MKFTVVSVAAQSLWALSRWYEAFQREHPEAGVELTAYFIATGCPADTRKKLCADVEAADFALIDLMGAPEDLINAVGAALETCKGQRLVIGYGCRDQLRLGKFAMGGGMMGGKKPKADPGPEGQGGLSVMSKMRKMAHGMRKALPVAMLRDMDNVFVLGDYWQSGLDSDIDNMMRLILRDYFGQKQLPKPAAPTLHNGIFLCDPFTREGYADAAAYRRQHPCTGKPVVAFLFYAHSYPNDLTPLLREAEARFAPFADILPIGFSNQVDKDMEQLRAILTAEKVALVVNFMSFRLGAGPMGGNAVAGVELLKELNVPMLCPFYSSKRTVEEWAASPKGAAPGDFLISIMMPELDGGIETMPLAAVGTVHRDEVLHLPLTELQPLPGRVERLAGRAQKWLALQSKANADKKVALLCYDYPPEESHLFSAAFLDGFASLSAVLHALKQAGYTTEEKTPEELEQLFCAGGLLNGSRYLSDTAGLHYKPAELAYENEISAAWGKAPGSILTEAEGYRIPGVQLGNVFIGLQPARVGAGEDAAAHYHDRDLPPHHQYAAFYQWLREEFGADAVVHVGTHGTLEFLPGKENGLSADCWADRLLQDLPNLYYYYCGNASEGMTAKRRSNAVLLTYAPPRFAESGLYGELAALDAALTEYREAQQAAPERAASVRRQLEQQAAALQLPTEPEALEQELYRTRCALIPEGLHCIGDGQPGELEGLLHALNGRYVPAAPMGDVRRQPEILPTGRNGYAFDPRFVPSPAAYQRGAEIAKAAMERYKAEHGCWPRRTAVVLWGLETAKTQGETVGQLLYYLGARMVWKGTSFLSRIEPIPTEEMDRPRVDVTVTICGFFRDLFPALLADLNRLLRQLDEMHETSEESAYAAETERLYQKLLAQGLAPEKARAAARGRFFGPKDGEYGTSLTELVKSGQWQDEKELGSLFTAELGYLYAEGIEGERIPGRIEEAFRNVELISQVRGDADYEITDLDHYYEFYGGLVKAVELAGGAKPAAYIVDTSTDKVYADSAAQSAARGVRTRILNPKWIDGMLAHSFHGAQKIADRFENVLGLAATAGCIPSETFAQMEHTYVSDPELRRRMAENNRYAYLAAMEKLMEADRRGYWQATDAEREELQQVYLETEGDVEDAL